MTRMRKNSRAQAASKNCKKTEEHSEDSEHHHVAHALIAMRRAKHQCRKHHAQSHVSLTPRCELALQISAEHRLFNQSRKTTEQHPGRNLASVFGSQLLQSAQRLLLRFARFNLLPWLRRQV